MKKISMLAAVFGVIIAAAMAASATSVDLGLNAGKLHSLRNVSFDFAADGANEDDAISIPEPGKPVSVIVSGAIADTVPSGENKSLEAHLDWRIKVAIAYSETARQFAVKRNLIKLLREGTIEEKHGFVYNNKEGYKFPVRFAAKSVPQICAKEHTERECINREVCRNVGHVGAIVCYIGSAGNQICGVGATVWELVCSIVPECSDVPICDEWVDAPHVYGTDSNGNYR